jgi:alkanesulfonate monooxygenase SsuD/methylene tetrahydromethanopterin reductase-like flavin-dependent oxidoreductase (luciferase family)
VAAGSSQVAAGNLSTTIRDPPLRESTGILDPSTTFTALVRAVSPKKIGFLSFGAWHPGGGLTRSGGDALRQTVELAVAAEEIGIDGAFVRVHHFARQLSSPFPLLSAIGVKTSRIEIGTGVIDMRYENPLYMAETAAAADLLAGGRLQLGVSRGSPEPAWHGSEAFGYSADADEAREKTALFRLAITGAGVVPADVGGRPGEATLGVQPQSPGLADRIWWGSGSRETAAWAGEQGMNLMSSTLLLEDTQVPFDQLQAEQIGLFREAWANAGHDREPRVSVSRSVIPITSDLDRQLFGSDTNEDQVGWLDGAISRFGRSYTGEPDQIAEELAKDAAVRAADTILLTVPSQLGVDYNAAMLETIAREIAPAIGWSPSTRVTA